jgi:ribosomal protein L21E
MSRRSALPLALALLCLAAAPLRSRGGEGVPGPEQLTAEERAGVRKLAEQALRERDLFKGKTYLTRIEVYYDSARTERHAIAIYYRYEGDLGILVHVDVGAGKVTQVEAVPHLPTSLTDEELAEAEKRARADRDVARALARYADGPKIEVDAQMALTVDPKDPNYHHRVVRLNFRRGREYLLRVPTVDVDLTTGRVRAQPLGKGHD